MAERLGDEKDQAAMSLAKRGLVPLHLAQADRLRNEADRLSTAAALAEVAALQLVQPTLPGFTPDGRIAKMPQPGTQHISVDRAQLTI